MDGGKVCGLGFIVVGVIELVESFIDVVKCGPGGQQLSPCQLV